MENPGSFTFNYAVAFFFSANNICIPIENYDHFFMQVCIIEYLLGTSQANEYRASKKKL